MNFKEGNLRRFVRSTNQVPVSPERAHETGQHHDARIGQNPANLSSTPNILGPIGLRKAKIPIQPMPKIVSVQTVYKPTSIRELLLQFHRHSAFPTSG
jgi:hypothetical protein